MRITKTDPFTGQSNTMSLDIDPLDYREWMLGRGLIQDVFPDLSPDQREFLMTGITQDSWDAAFTDDEDDKGEQL